ncbi:MAG: amidohydrolase family protein [Cloacibacillus sp.]
MTKKIYTNATIIDGNGGKPLQNGALLVDDDRITAVGEAREFCGCEEAEAVDCTGKTIMPGLINGHVHFFMEPYTWERNACIQQPLSGLCLDIQSNMKKMLRSGVTYARDLGGVFDLDMQFRGYVDEGRVEGPEMICARNPLTITGGHGEDFSMVCDGPQAFIHGVRSQIRGGADLIKIMATAGYARPKMRVNHSIIADTIYMSPEEIKASTDEAHKMGKMVAAHCCGFAGVYNSVMNGVDTIEHGQFREPESDEAKALADEMAKRGVWLVPTLAAFFKEYDREEVEKQYQSVIESFRLCLKAGVKIAMGTDAGVPWVGHDKTAAELEHMSLYGMTAMEAIVASTKSAAQMLGVSQNYGTLEGGKYADFLILEKNPLEDITALQHNLQAVFKKGRAVGAQA